MPTLAGRSSDAPLALVIALAGGLLVGLGLASLCTLVGHEYVVFVGFGSVTGAIVGAFVGFHLFGLAGGMVAGVVFAFLMPVVVQGSLWDV